MNLLHTNKSIDTPIHVFVATPFQSRLQTNWCQAIVASAFVTFNRFYMFHPVSPLSPSFWGQPFWIPWWLLMTIHIGLLMQRSLKWSIMHVLAGFNATYLLTRLCGISLSHMLLQQTILANDISLFKVFVYPLVWIGFVTLVKLRTPWHWDTDAAWDGEDDGAGALVWIRVCVLFEFNLHCSNEMFATGGLFSDVQFSFWIHAGYIMTNSHVALAERCSQCCLLQRNKEIFLKKRNSWDFVQQIIVFF